MKVLLHTCCAPCATHCLSELRSQGYTVALFFSNANIAPDSEYQRRLDSVRKLSEQMEVPLIIDKTSHESWLQEVAAGHEEQPEGGIRCTRCFSYSLKRTHSAMQELGFNHFTSTLTVSPHKHTPAIFAAAQEIDPTAFLPLNFKKKDGFARSLKMSRELDLYRQSYCGCEFS